MCYPVGNTFPLLPRDGLGRGRYTTSLKCPRAARIGVLRAFCDKRRVTYQWLAGYGAPARPRIRAK